MTFFKKGCFQTSCEHFIFDQKNKNLREPGYCNKSIFDKCPLEETKERARKHNQERKNKYK